MAPDSPPGQGVTAPGAHPPAARDDGGAAPGGHFAAFLNTRTFGSLDGLRAIAILVVVWHHAAPPVPGWMLTERGFLGVDLFFVISGFLIPTLLLRERRRSGGISLRDFYVRRFLRIFPAYYLMLLVVGITTLVLPGTNSAAVRREIGYAALYLSNLVPMHSMLAITWSLAVEEQFYLVVPTLEKYARRVLPLVLPIAYVLSTLPTFGLFPEVTLPPFFRSTTFGPILLGVMLAHLLDRPSGFAWVSRLVGWRMAPLVALGLVLLASSHPAADISGWPRIAIHWAIVLLVAACVVEERNALRPFLGLWPMRRIGIVSYGIYLYHLLAMHFVVKAMKATGVASGLVAFLATSLASWAIAELSYRFFEMRFLGLKAKFAGRKQATSPPQVAVAAGAPPPA